MGRAKRTQLNPLVSHLPELRLPAAAFPLCIWRDEGLYCPSGDFWIDPDPRQSAPPFPGAERSSREQLALVTHAHADHARPGYGRYGCAQSGVELLKTRLGSRYPVEGWPYGERRQLGGVWVSFHPAGHILGSAQIRLERVQAPSEVWVISGDYKREADPSCEPFEGVLCDTFVTEATYGTPAYQWPPQTDPARLGEQLWSWWSENRRQGQVSVLMAYSLGKAQRLLALLEPWTRSGSEEVWIHPSMAALTECYRNQGRILAKTRVLRLPLEDFESPPLGSLVLLPPSAERKFCQSLASSQLSVQNIAWGWASGWTLKSPKRVMREFTARSFLISDHADWNDLNRTILETRAKQVYVLHRGNGSLVRALRAQGLQADSIEALRISPAALACSRSSFRAAHENPDQLTWDWGKR
jgi:putative mRNA 3-end processing factor